MDSVVEDEGFSKLPISLYHGQLAGQLPALHRDPFDRMLIAQAQAEGLILVTADEIIAQYGLRLRDPRE
jgi:PIN domain nuclease of toxin-antitoxin system